MNFFFSFLCLFQVRFIYIHQMQYISFERAGNVATYIYTQPTIKMCIARPEFTNTHVRSFKVNASEV